jgi:hypothetical protein
MISGESCFLSPEIQFEIPGSYCPLGPAAAPFAQAAATIPATRSAIHQNPAAGSADECDGSASASSTTRKVSLLRSLWHLGAIGACAEFGIDQRCLLFDELFEHQEEAEAESLDRRLRRQAKAYRTLQTDFLTARS